MNGDGGKGTVLIVDDEREIADLVAVYLEAEGYQTQVRYDAAGALEAVADPDIAIDLAVLDVMLPDMNGFHLCREIRKTHRWPIIMLTARDDEVDKITGLNFGADDYVTKPFRPLELVARVNAQLRRYTHYDRSAGGTRREEERYEYRGLTVDLRTRAVSVDGRRVRLSPASSRSWWRCSGIWARRVSAEELFHAMWDGEPYLKTSNAISVHVRHLRDKIGDQVDRPRFIHTVWGRRLPARRRLLRPGTGSTAPIARTVRLGGPIPVPRPCRRFGAGARRFQMSPSRSIADGGVPAAGSPSSWPCACWAPWGWGWRPCCCCG